MPCSSSSKRVGKTISAKWGALSVHEKAVYQAVAEHDRIRYKREKQEFYAKKEQSAEGKQEEMNVTTSEDTIADEDETNN